MASGERKIRCGRDGRGKGVGDMGGACSAGGLSGAAVLLCGMGVSEIIFFT